MAKERSSKSERSRIRSLKQSGELLSKKNWKILLTEHLGIGLGSLGEEGLRAVTKWFGIRSKFRAGEIDKEQFELMKDKFSDQYDEVIRNGKVGEAIKFISQKTAVTGLTKTTIRD